jgi:hypothetical protein
MSNDPERCTFAAGCQCTSCLNERVESDDEDESDYCRICGVYLDGDEHERASPDSTVCAECAEDTVDDGPYSLPDEFDDDDGQHDFSEEDIVT